jgi:UDP-glucuronate 4-epimerase
MFKKKRFLITGVAGFIGFYLAKKLCEDGFFIYGIDNFDPYYSVNLKKKKNRTFKKI